MFQILNFRCVSDFIFQPLHLVEVEAAEEVRGAGGHGLCAEAGRLVQCLQEVGNLLQLNSARPVINNRYYIDTVDTV